MIEESDNYLSLNNLVIHYGNLEVVKNADWIIDLGPEGGDGGGYLVGEGTPQDLARGKDSYTGGFLRKILK